ncbi:MAG: hypothetical protein C4318_06835 [Acidimicrobiia bacterium]
MSRPKHDRWWILMLASLGLTAGGLVLIFWPSEDARVLGRAIGIVFAANGILFAISAFSVIRLGYDWAVLAFEAIWMLSLGLPLWIDPSGSATALASVTGAVLFLGSAIQVLLVAALKNELFGPDRELLEGMLGLVLGAAMLRYPTIGVRGVATLTGIWMLGSGVLVGITALVLAGFGNLPDYGSGVSKTA